MRKQHLLLIGAGLALWYLARSRRTSTPQPPSRATVITNPAPPASGGGSSGSWFSRILASARSSIGTPGIRA